MMEEWQRAQVGEEIGKMCLEPHERAMATSGSESEKLRGGEEGEDKRDEEEEEGYIAQDRRRIRPRKRSRDSVNRMKVQVRR
jgi:hypothetical protein